MAFLRIICLSLLLSACHPRGSLPQDTGYFPLSPGWTWEYRVSEKTATQFHQRSRIFKTLPSIQTEGGETRHRRINDAGTVYEFIQTPQGWARVARENLFGERREDHKPRLVLPEPLDTQLEWELLSRPFVIQQVQPFRAHVFRDIWVDLSYQVVETNATIEVPAGRFENCVRVQAQGEAAILSDVALSRLGETSAQIVEDSWYAPGVGLVKLVRREQMANELFEGGELSLQLLRFESPH